MPLTRRPSRGSTPDAPPTTAAALTRGSDEARWAAARSAADRPDAAPALADAILRERNPRVREAMFTSLGRIGTAESVEGLLALLRSDDPALRTGALDTLCTLTGVVGPYIAPLLHDADADVRVLACELVRVLPSDEASRLLSALLDGELEQNVCASAIEVLAEVGGIDALPALARCESRFPNTPFLQFSIRVTTDRIRSQSPQSRG